MYQQGVAILFVCYKILTEEVYMEFKHDSGIYVCRCVVNGMCYVGQSNDVKRRKYSHIASLRHGNHYNSVMQEVFDEFGEETFEWDVLEYCPVELLNERERYWINEFDAIQHGFNTYAGGYGRFERTEEFTQMMSAKIRRSWDNDPERKEYFSRNMSGENNPMYGHYGSLNPAYGQDHSGEKGGMFGKHHSEESKELNRVAHLGANNKMSKPVICIETGEIFASQGEAGREKHCNDTSINKCCRGITKTAVGYHWRYATEENF